MHAGLRLFVALAFAFTVWSAIILGVGGRACTPRFDLNAAFGWWESYTVLGFLYMLPTVALLTALAYAGVARLGFIRNPATLFLLAAAIVASVFALAVLLTPANGRCVWP